MTHQMTNRPVKEFQFEISRIKKKVQSLDEKNILTTINLKIAADIEKLSYSIFNPPQDRAPNRVRLTLTGRPDPNLSLKTEKVFSY